ncbi:hypothetical protein B5S28_g772 [[Candida] boidinii]|nr:hypothetical protein B5S28_g772 [[Candida] boidinii]OWB72181.1 hypothetical protein B5S31_g1887 [[Candida] boidinii]
MSEFDEDDFYEEVEDSYNDYDDDEEESEQYSDEELGDSAYESHDDDDANDDDFEDDLNLYRNINFTFKQKETAMGTPTHRMKYKSLDIEGIEDILKNKVENLDKILQLGFDNSLILMLSYDWNEQRLLEDLTSSDSDIIKEKFGLYVESDENLQNENPNLIKHLKFDQLLSDAEEGYMCNICCCTSTKDEPLKKFRLSNCDHSYCADCYIQLVREKNNNNLIKYKCPEPQCNLLIKITEIKILSEYEEQKIKEKLNQMLQNNSHRSMSIDEVSLKFSSSLDIKDKDKSKGVKGEDYVDDDDDDDDDDEDDDDDDYHYYYGESKNNSDGNKKKSKKKSKRKNKKAKQSKHTLISDKYSDDDDDSDDDSDDDYDDGPDGKYDKQESKLFNYMERAAANEKQEKIRKRNKSLYLRYWLNIIRVYASKNSKLFKNCPAKDCDSLIQLLGFDSDEISTVEDYTNRKYIPIVQCSNGHRFCFSCLKDDHAPSPCVIVSNWIKKCKDDSETSHWITLNTRECPKCHNSIEKDGGCNHMTCQSCGHEFCWICFKNWSLHGTSYYKCTFFDPTNKKEENDKLEANRVSLKKYLFYYNLFDIQRSSLKKDQKFCKKLEIKVHKIQQHIGVSWIEAQFYRHSIDILLRCRHTLMWSFALLYYLVNDTQKQWLQSSQASLMIAVEKLSKLFETTSIENVIKKKNDFLNLSAIAEKSRNAAIEVYMDAMVNNLFELKANTGIKI